MGSKLNILGKCIVIIALLCINFASYAQEKSVGSLVKVIQESTISNANGEKNKAKLRAMIYAGDTITTQAESWVTINFFDLTRVVLRPNSELMIHEFAQTMADGNIRLEVVKGGARITSGTIAEDNDKRFVVTTPAGDILGEKAEWVVQICDDNSCVEIENNSSQCSNYQNPEKENRLFLSVYKGAVDLDYCPTKQRLDRGLSLVSAHNGENCLAIEQVPCFILADGELGRDQFRQFSSSLTSIDGESSDQLRPDVKINRDRPTITRPIR